MIETHNLKEAYHQYEQQKIPFRLLQEQAVVIRGLCQNPQSSISDPLEITQIDIDWLMQQAEATQNYGELLGGTVYVCETEQDLLQIHGCNFEWADEHHGNWPNVTDIPMTWDACDYLAEASGDPQWVVFVLCWNNAGGPVYYVPKHLWVRARVTEHIEVTNSTSTI